jgi:hypothetical protein
MIGTLDLFGVDAIGLLIAIVVGIASTILWPRKD